MSRRNRLGIERLEDRFTPSIGLDTTFNATGKVLTNFGPGADRPLAIDVDAGNRTVVLATTNTTGEAASMLLTRFNPNGTLDTTFASDGIVRLDFDTARAVTPKDLAVFNDGRIVVLATEFGKVQLYGFALNGSLDSSFGTDGVAEFAFSGNVTATANRLHIDSTDKLLVAGSIVDGTEQDFLTIRFNDDGTPDDSFGTLGVVSVDFGQSDEAFDLVQQSDGKIVVVGTVTENETAIDLGIVRIDANGDFDTAFDGDGKRNDSFGDPVSAPRTIELLTGDLFVVATSNSGDLIEAIYDNTNGSQTHQFSIELGEDGDFATGLALQTDGKVVIAGGTGTNRLAFARVDAAGALDSSFGTDGIALVTFPVASDVTNAGVGLRSDGKLISVAGVTSVTSIDETIVRLNANGSLDSTFGVLGKVTLPNQGRSVDVGVVVRHLTDGKLVVFGNTASDHESHQNLAIARYHPNGLLDASFDGDGKLTLNLGESFALSAALIQSDGKWVIAGESEDDSTGERTILLVRLNPNGTFDNSFDSDGKLSLVMVGTSAFVDRLAIQSDGKLLISVGGDEPLLFRRNANGSADNSFDGDGKLSSVLGLGTTVTDLLPQADGTLLVMGGSDAGAVIRRVRADGSIDPSFGNQGTVTIDDFDATMIVDGILRPDGSLVGLGKGPTQTFLAALKGDGAFDSTFGAAGQVELVGIDLADFESELFAFPDGSLLMASQTDASPSTVTLIRVTSDGTLDPSYGTAGIAEVSIADAMANVLGYHLTSDNRLLITGGQSSELSVARIDPGFLPLTITLDPTSDLGTSPTDGITTDRTPRFTGFTTAGAKVELFSGKNILGTTTADTDGRWTIDSLALIDGDYTIFAKASDTSDNVTQSGNVSITIDATPPTVTISPAGAPNPSAKTVAFTLRFSEPVFGLEISDLSVGGTAGGIVSVLSGSGSEYTVTIAELERSGVLILSLAAGGVIDQAGTANVAGGFQTLINLDTPPTLGGPNYVAGPGLGGTPVVRVIDGSTGQEVNSFTPFDTGFTGGVRVAMADINNDGTDDIVAGTGIGVATEVRVLDGKTGAELYRINPFEASFTGGVYVAIGDLNRDGFDDMVITPDQGGGPRVQIISGKDGFPLRGDFFGIEDPNFFGGARASLADVNGDGTLDLLVAAGFGGGPRIAVFDGRSVVSDSGLPRKLFDDFFVFEPTLRNGVYITGGDLDGDGYAEIIAGGGPGGGPRVFALSGQDLSVDGIQVSLANFFAGDIENRGGIRVAVKNVDNDQRADLIVGEGDNAGSTTTVYRGADIQPNQSPPAFQSINPFPGFMNGVFVG